MPHHRHAKIGFQRGNTYSSPVHMTRHNAAIQHMDMVAHGNTPFRESLKLFFANNPKPEKYFKNYRAENINHPPQSDIQNLENRPLREKIITFRRRKMQRRPNFHNVLRIAVHQMALAAGMYFCASAF